MYALKLRPTVGILVALVSAGCATNRVRVDYNPRTSFTAFRTYAWIDQSTDSGRHPAIHSQLVERRIYDAVERELTARGFRKATSGTPDFHIAYHVVSDTKIDVRAFEGVGARYYGYPYGYLGYFGYGYRGTSQQYAREYIKGTLILDVVDARSDELIWRGWMSEALDDDPKPENVRMYVDAAVSKILARFPPASDAPARVPTAKPTTT